MPDDASAPYGAGELQALKVVGADRLDTGDERLGAMMDVEWVGLTEPTPSGDWLADLAPVDGPQIGPFDKRSEALAAEVAWLQQNWLTRSDE